MTRTLFSVFLRTQKPSPSHFATELLCAVSPYWHSNRQNVAPRANMICCNRATASGSLAVSYGCQAKKEGCRFMHYLKTHWGVCFLWKEQGFQASFFHRRVNECEYSAQLAASSVCRRDHVHATSWAMAADRYCSDNAHLSHSSFCSCSGGDERLRTPQDWLLLCKRRKKPKRNPPINHDVTFHGADAPVRCHSVRIVGRWLSNIIIFFSQKTDTHR